MGYVALYRKYRPITFDNIIGQNNVITILKKQVESLKISHAYIFSGTRGTGKTSAAKVFARAINCLNPKNGEPCNECESCKRILDGDMTDVVEMDAASNNSVENIRQIRNEVMYVATNAKYKIYIIDEAHMLTNSAFNALLKTLEEPPENVIFILATTEQHKIPVTILSRCLRFEFNKITINDIIDRLKVVLKDENIKYEDEAIEYIAKKADGALRDALSILDRCLTENSEILTLKTVQNILGTIDKEIIENIVEGIDSKDSVEVIKNIDILINKSKDLRALVYDLMEMFLEKLISSNSVEDITKYNEIISCLSKLDSDIKLSNKPEIIVKSALIRLSNNKKTDEELNITLNNKCSNNESFDYERINKLEEEINKLKDVIINYNKGNNNNSNSIKNIKENNDISEVKDDFNENNSNKLKSKQPNKTTYFDFEKFKSVLPSFGKMKLIGVMAVCKMKITDTEVLIGTDNDYAYKTLSDKKEIKDIENILLNKFNVDLPVKIKYIKKDNSLKLEKLIKDNNLEYTNLDDLIEE